MCNPYTWTRVVVLALVCGFTLVMNTFAADHRPQRRVSDGRSAERLSIAPVSQRSPSLNGLLFQSSASDGQTWLQTHQNPSFSWGSTYEFVDTCTVIQALQATGPQSTELANGAAWLASQSTDNYEYLARQVLAISGVPGCEPDVALLAQSLLAARNPAETDNTRPNWPDGGWGLAAGYATDCMTTAVALQALKAAGLAGGMAVQSKPLGAGGVNTHEFDVPADALRVRIEINVTGSQVRVFLSEGAPTQSGYYFPVSPGTTYTLTYPDNGLPFAPGHNYICVQSTGSAATYTLTASYETASYDTRTVAEPIAYLTASQNADGGWGLQRGGTTEFYTTLHVLLCLQDYAHYGLASQRSSAVSYVKTQQLAGGAFGYDATPLPYVTALAAMTLIRSETYPFTAPVQNAVTALRNMQSAGGSWDEEPYDTALAVLALWQYDQPPTANAGPDQWVLDVHPGYGEQITLSGSGSDIDGTVESYVWSEGGVQLATGASATVNLARGRHTIQLTVTDNGGRTATDTMVVLVTTSPGTFYLENMDTNPGWTTGGLWAWGIPTGQPGVAGMPGGNDPTSGYTGTHVYGYNLNGGYENNLPATYLTTTAIDCSNYAGVHLKFRRWLCVEESIYDHASVEVSNNPADPGSWVTVWNHVGGTLLETAWSLQDYDISAVADGHSAVYIRWAMGPSDYDWNFGGWNIDDVELTGGCTLPLILGDLNGDGHVDSLDLLILAQAWGSVSGNANYDWLCDINSDGSVNVIDLLLLADNWGT